jgi:hypothetical protein
MLKDGELSAIFKDEEKGELEISEVSFSDGILSFGLVIPELGENPLTSWLKVDGEVFEGALGGEDDGRPVDFPMKGQRK